MRDLKQEIDAKHHEVCVIYANAGLCPAYYAAFGELSALRMQDMANTYRKVRGLLPGAPTPYDEEKVS